MTFTARVVAFLRERPNVWIDARDFEPIGGRQAWRSRIAEARLQFQAAGLGTVENRCRRIRTADGSYVRSEYRFVPAVKVETNGQMALI